MKFSVVIPAYNEAAILPATIKALTQALQAMQHTQQIDTYELIFVSDGSSDATPQLLQNAAAMDSHILPIIYTPNKGKGGAVRTGILASTGDLVLYTDSDLAYGTAILETAVKTILIENADLLIGSRAIHPEGYAGYTWTRKTASRLYLRILAWFAGFSHSDSQCGFKIMRGQIGRALFSDMQTDSFAFDFELLLRAQKAGAVVAELPVTIVNHRTSSVHLIRDALQMLGDIRTIKRSIK